MNQLDSKSINRMIVYVYIPFLPILFMMASILASVSAFERGSVGITRMGQKLR